MKIWSKFNDDFDTDGQLMGLHQIQPSIERRNHLEFKSNFYDESDDSVHTLCRFKYSILLVSHRECGQFRPCVHENFEKFKIISTSTGSGIRSRLRPHQLPVGVEIILNFYIF